MDMQKLWAWSQAQKHTWKLKTSWSASSGLVEEYEMHQGTQTPLKTRCTCELHSTSGRHQMEQIDSREWSPEMQLGYTNMAFRVQWVNNSWVERGNALPTSSTLTLYLEHQQSAGGTCHTSYGQSSVGLKGSTMQLHLNLVLPGWTLQHQTAELWSMHPLCASSQVVYFQIFKLHALNANYKRSILCDSQRLHMKCSRVQVEYQASKRCHVLDIWRLELRRSAGGHLCSTQSLAPL